jgi:hypothetical protein
VQKEADEKFIKAAHTHDPLNPFSEQTPLYGTHFDKAWQGIATLRYNFTHIKDKWRYLAPLLQPFLPVLQPSAAAGYNRRDSTGFDSDFEELEEDQKRDQQAEEEKRLQSMRQTAMLK